MKGNIYLAIVMAMSIIISLALGPIIIPILRKLKIGQSIREEGPKEHYKKKGTPTIGGIIIVLSVILTLAFTREIQKVIIPILAMIGFGMIGFIDDFIKVVLKRSLGLKAYQKIVGQLIISILLAFYFLSTSYTGSKVLNPINMKYIDLGILFIPFITIVIIAVVNSANLTDGLDGLAGGVTAIVLIAFMVVALKFGNKEIAVFAASLAGASIGFLKHNWYPAKVFMGDTGSMALGGAVVAVALSLNLVMIIPLICGIYFAEALSVIIQVTYFRKTGKRVFLMSPLHHHYEQKGWSEKKVVYSFYSVTLILCVISVLLLSR